MLGQSLLLSCRGSSSILFFVLLIVAGSGANRRATKIVWYGALTTLRARKDLVSYIS